MYTFCTHPILPNILKLNEFIEPARCVWCGTILGAKNTLACHGGFVARSPRSNAKRRASGAEMRLPMSDLISLMR